MYRVVIDFRGKTISNNEFSLACEAWEAYRTSVSNFPDGERFLETRLFKNTSSISPQILQTLKIAESKKITRLSEYTKTPGGRYMTDGPYSGEWFHNLLIKDHRDMYIVDLDDGYGVRPGFLSEAFLGLDVYVICKEEPKLAGRWRN